MEDSGAFFDVSVFCDWLPGTLPAASTYSRYSSNLGRNTFPVPALLEQNKADLMRCAEEIVLTREAHFSATFADLYDPEHMPVDLRAAHDSNDETLERIYIGREFRNETERLEKLFELYTQMTVRQSSLQAARAASAKPMSTRRTEKKS